MTFNEILSMLPTIEGLRGIEVLDSDKVINQIPAVEGKLGSLRVYNALAEQFAEKLDRQSAEQGLIWFAEHTADAKANPGKHPNIDLLLKVIAQNLQYRLRRLK